MLRDEWQTEKSADGKPLHVTLTNGVATYDKEISTSTDMYYTIRDIVSSNDTDLSESKLITITNNTGSEGVLSLTHVKLTCPQSWKVCHFIEF